ELDQNQPAADEIALHLRTELEEALVLLRRAEAHHVLHAGAVVPTAVEDHHLARRWKVLKVSLHVELGLFTVRRRGERRDAEHARAEALGDGANRPAFARPIPTFEHDDDPQPLLSDVALQITEPHLQLSQGFFVFAPLHRLPGGLTAPADDESLRRSR